MGLTLIKHNAGDLLVASVVNSNWTGIENKFNSTKILLTELKTPYYIRDWTINRKLIQEWDGGVHKPPLPKNSYLEFYNAIRKTSDITSETLHMIYFRPTFLTWSGGAADHKFRIILKKANFIAGAGSFSIVYASGELPDGVGYLLTMNTQITLGDNTEYLLELHNLSVADDISWGNINIDVSFKSYLRE